MKLPVDIKVQEPPNFILLDGFGGSIPVGKLSREQATTYANLLRDGFLQHWERKREQRIATSRTRRHGRELGQYDG